MKFREGFVSNSSSSSFIAVGFSVPESDEMKRQIILKFGDNDIVAQYKDHMEDPNFDNRDWDYFLDDTIREINGEVGVIVGSCENGVPSNTLFVHSFCEAPGECEVMARHKLPLKLLMEKTQKIGEALGLQVTPELITGTRSC
jgi:hypothetical protein